ncbi:hypothetical protein AB7B76_06275 [Klebsiella pneumoniae]
MCCLFSDPESKRSCILVTVTGQGMPLLQYQNGSIERPALQEEIQRLIPMTLRSVHRIHYGLDRTVTRRMALNIETISGEVDIPLLKIADGAIEPEMLSPNLQGLVPVYLTPDSGYVMARIDERGYVHGNFVNKGGSACGLPLRD